MSFTYNINDIFPYFTQTFNSGIGIVLLVAGVSFGFAILGGLIALIYQHYRGGD